MRWKNENLSDLSQMINGLMSSFSVVKEELKILRLLNGIEETVKIRNSILRILNSY